jgi:hypothetical protein
MDRRASAEREREVEVMFVCTQVYLGLCRICSDFFSTKPVEAVACVRVVTGGCDRLEWAGHAVRTDKSRTCKK